MNFFIYVIKYMHVCILDPFMHVLDFFVYAINILRAFDFDVSAFAHIKQDVLIFLIYRKHFFGFSMSHFMVTF